jgi:hypothetical protein
VFVLTADGRRGNYGIATRGVVDTVMQLFDASGKLVVSDDNSGMNGNARIITSLPKGTFILKVSAKNKGFFTIAAQRV